MFLAVSGRHLRGYEPAMTQISNHIDGDEIVWQLEACLALFGLHCTRCTDFGTRRHGTPESPDIRHPIRKAD